MPCGRSKLDGPSLALRLALLWARIYISGLQWRRFAHEGMVAMDVVLVTGASSGIGLELVRLFAADGRPVVMVSSHRDRIEAAREDVEGSLDVSVTPRLEVIPVDLAHTDAPGRLAQALQERDMEVTTLVNCAGFGAVGETVDIAPETDEAMLAVNCGAVVGLTKRFLPAMYERGEGRVLNVASTGAFQPGPYNATYYASKAFVLSYTRAVRVEAARHGVTVCCLCPGATRTGFFERAGTPVSPGAMSAASVARAGYRGLARGRAVIVPGVRNRLMQLAPTPLKVAVVTRLKRR